MPSLTIRPHKTCIQHSLLLTLLPVPLCLGVRLEALSGWRQLNSSTARTARRLHLSTTRLPKPKPKPTQRSVPCWQVASGTRPAPAPERAAPSPAPPECVLGLLLGLRNLRNEPSRLRARPAAPPERVLPLRLCLRNPPKRAGPYLRNALLTLRPLLARRLCLRVRLEPLLGPSSSSSSELELAFERFDPGTPNR
jgi:hypothetical protein